MTLLIIISRADFRFHSESCRSFKESHWGLRSMKSPIGDQEKKLIKELQVSK